jgi:uncharacterized protein (DUF2132 family)
VNGQDYFLESKSDGLAKHQGWTKALRDIPSLGVKRDEYYWNQDSRHMKAERALSATSTDSILKALARAPRKRKEVQFAVLFHLLSLGRPMTEYEGLRDLLEHLRVLKLPIKHWSDTSGSEMAESINQIVMQKMAEMLGAARYVAITCDEVTTADCQSWISIHAYIIRDWERYPILLQIERVVHGTRLENITRTVLSTLSDDGGLSKLHIRDHLMCFSADGISVL